MCTLFKNLHSKKSIFEVISLSNNSVTEKKSVPSIPIICYRDQNYLQSFVIPAIRPLEILLIGIETATVFLGMYKNCVQAFLIFFFTFIFFKK